MPGAVAVRPKDGQVFVASMKTGELFALRDPTGDGKNARFENYGHGLFQDALSMMAEDDGLVRPAPPQPDEDHRVPSSQGSADTFDRVAALPHGVADTYDMAYGLARDTAAATGSSATPPTPTRRCPAAGGAIRLTPGKPAEEIAYGMRNPLGWCAGPEGEIFFTDNQGDWVGDQQALPPGAPASSTAGPTRRSSSTTPSPPARRRSGCRTAGPGRSTASPTTTPAASSGRSPASSSWPS